MKKRIFTGFIAMAFAFAIAGCSNEGAQNSDAAETTFTEKVVEADEDGAVAFMAIEGMSCEVGCAKFINKKLSVAEGVLASEIDFEEGIAKVSFDPEKTNAKDLAGMVNKLNDGQYKVVNVEVEKRKKAANAPEVKESSSKASSSDNDLEQVSFRSISFPNVFNLFKLKLV
jgi:periplasmic mercuric ion binding protein